MENDSSSKSTGGDKKNWRERLGINKDLPKIAAEFREEQRAAPPAAANRPTVAGANGGAGVQTAERPRPASEQPGPGTGQPIASPAPMAPRRTSVKPPLPGTRPAAAPEASKPAETAPEQPNTGVTTKHDDFSARLRAQREAAERLAEQRFAARREAPTPPTGIFARPAPVSQSPEEPEHSLAEKSTLPDAAPIAETSDIDNGKPAEVSRPKFSFAPQELGKEDEHDALASDEASAESPAPPQAPVAPVRPTAAGLSAPPLRPTFPADQQPTIGGNYPAGNMPPRPEYSNAPPLQASAGAAQPQPAPVRQTPPPLQPGPAPAPARGRRPIDYVDEDLEDVFDDTRQGRAPGQRASIDDYNAAYRGFDDGFEEEEDERRSGSGPIILILALLTVAAIAGALVYFYRSGTTTTANTPESVPVITAPDKPVKSEPDQAAQPTQPAQPAGRKQIYDRILGEETMEPETVVPTEEAPQAPAAAQDTTSQPSGSETEPLPLPLPPPPGSTGQQGSVTSPAPNQTVARMTQTGTVTPTGVSQAANSGRTDQQVIKQAPVPKVEQTTIAAIPPPEPLSEPAGAVASATEASEPAAETVQTPAIQPAAPATTAPTVATTRQSAPLPRAKPSQRVAAVTQAQPAPAPSPAPIPTQPATSGSGPVLLAPQAPAPAPVQPQTQSGLQLPSFLQDAQDTGSSNRRSTGRLDDEDPLAGSRRAQTATTASPAQQLTALQPQTIQPQPTQPSVSPAPTPAQPSPALVAPSPQPAQPATSASTGYVVQLASYRSEGEAQNEFQRLRSRHSRLIGNLQPRIQKAELGAAGTFYRLGVGPLGTKQAASNLCNSLIASGEKDCLVRRR